MNIKKNNYKYTKNELKLINEHYQNHNLVYLYKFNFSITSYTKQYVLDNYFNNYFNNKNYNNLSNFDKLSLNIILVYKLIVILNNNKILINDGNINYQKNYLYNIINHNCDLFIKKFYEYENHSKYISDFGIPNFYDNCNHSEVYTKKFSNIKNLEKFLILEKYGNIITYDNIISNFFKSFLYNLNKISPIIKPNFLVHNIHNRHEIEILNNCIRHHDVIIFYNRLTKKISLNFIKDKEIFDNFLEKKHKIFIKNFFNFLEKNFDWDFIFHNVNKCNYCNKEINLIDIRDLDYTFDSKKKELSIMIKPIIHSKTLCFPENNIIINENINNYKLVDIYEKLVLKLWKEILFHKIDYYNYYLTRLLIKYNMKTPSQYKIIISSYPLEVRKDYLVVFLQFRKKINSYQNNLFKIITNFLL